MAAPRFCRTANGEKIIRKGVRGLMGNVGVVGADKLIRIGVESIIVRVTI